MKLRYKKTETRTVTEDVPDEFGGDDTLHGKIVDALLEPYEHRGTTARERLFDDDLDVVEGALHLVRGTYEVADRILAKIKDHVIP